MFPSGIFYSCAARKMRITGMLIITANFAMYNSSNVFKHLLAGLRGNGENSKVDMDTTVHGFPKDRSIRRQMQVTSELDQQFHGEPFTLSAHENSRP